MELAAMIIIAVASVLMAVWLILLSIVTQDDWVAAATDKVVSNLNAIDALEKKDAAKREKLLQYSGLEAKVMALLTGGDSGKEIAKMERQNERLRVFDLGALPLWAMPGYALQSKIESLGRGSLYKKITVNTLELYGKKYAMNMSRQLIAKLVSYPLIGVAATLALGALVLRVGALNAGLGILVGGTLLMLFLVYAMYDELGDRVKKRRETIARQFPNIVSKLALLVTSGMIMDRAWKETAHSQSDELYMEMRKTSEELDNLVNPETAYGNFINRCNTKETSKLASAIIQNLTKGNAEIGLLLKSLAHEAWNERRNIAKRDSEKANSKLMIPTMMLFIAILVMIMVPVVINFQGL